MPREQHGTIGAHGCVVSGACRSRPSDVDGEWLRVSTSAQVREEPRSHGKGDEGQGRNGQGRRTNPTSERPCRPTSTPGATGRRPGVPFGPPRPGRSTPGGARDRSDRIRSAILMETSKGRVERLVPIRYGRMVQSPFAFFRGAAAIMAADLGATAIHGLRGPVLR